MDVRHLVTAMESIAPPALAEPWDNVGLLVGDPSAPLTRVLLAIDYTAAVAAEALHGAYDAVVAYHPVIFKDVTRVIAGSRLWDAVRKGVAVYSPHTALDIAPGGTNDVLAGALGLDDITPLRPLAPRGGRVSLGMGRIGRLPLIPRGEVIARVKRALGIPHILVAGPTDGIASTGAVGAGSCGDLVRDAIAKGVDVYLTGELRHHDALAAVDAGMTVLCTLHSNSERATLKIVRQRLVEGLPGVTVDLSVHDRDPFVVE